MLRTTRQIALLASALLVMAPASVWAQSAESKARIFLENEARAKNILAVAHPEAKFQSCRPVLDNLGAPVKRSVLDGQRNPVPDHFCLPYQFTWVSPGSGDTNVTEMTFFFNKFGNIYQITPGDTTSFFRPFGTLKAAIQVFGDEMIRQVDNNPQATDADRRLVRDLVRASDPVGLLTMSLKLQQR
jgi:hypothetical protein